MEEEKRKYQSEKLDGNIGISNVKYLSIIFSYTFILPYTYLNIYTSKVLKGLSH